MSTDHSSGRTSATASKALETAEALLRAHRAQDWSQLRALFHPDARIGVFATGGALVDAEQALEAMMRAHEDSMYSATADRISVIDDDVIVLEGYVRHRTSDGGLAFVQRAWLYVLADGRLYRSAVFDAAHDARAAYRALGRTLGV